MKKIAIIPARSGSKGLPNKNILNLCGKPLIAWTIEAAIKSNCFDRIIVSTDSDEYGTISKKYGAEVIYRSEKASSDTASTYDALEEIFSKMDTSIYDYFVLLQPTSPLRTEKHIIEAIELFEKNIDTKNTLVSVQEAHKSSILIKQIDESLSLENFDIDYSNYSRQKFKEFEPNGAIFISKIDYYLKVKHFFGKNGIAYIMDKESSIDIDDNLDFELAIAIQNKKIKKDLLFKDITDRIKKKENLFRKKESNEKTITFIGHSQLDNWNISNLKDYKIINCAISGISSFEYNDLILSNNMLNCVSDIYIMMHGTNDIIYDYSYEQIYNSILKNIKYIRSYKPNAIIFFISCIHVNGRMDRNNRKIDELNTFLKHKFAVDGIIWIDTCELNDNWGNLKSDYTYDGLHLNENGYELLKKIIEIALFNKNL